MQRVGVLLVILLVLLAPWGGPCDRQNRSADPTTLRFASIGGQASESQPFLDGLGNSADPDELCPDILEDEEDGEGFEIRNIAGQTSPYTPPSPRALDAMDGGRHHDHSGRSARSSFLLC
jgi:hypothetical protein